MYYARFKETDKEIATFNTEKDRDDWVNYQDEFSAVFGANAENSAFERMAITEQQKNNILHNRGILEVIADSCNIGQSWIICGGAAI